MRLQKFFGVTWLWFCVTAITAALIWLSGTHKSNLGSVEHLDEVGGFYHFTIGTPRSLFKLENCQESPKIPGEIVCYQSVVFLEGIGEIRGVTYSFLDGRLEGVVFGTSDPAVSNVLYIYLVALFGKDQPNEKMLKAGAFKYHEWIGKNVMIYFDVLSTGFTNVNVISKTLDAKYQKLLPELEKESNQQLPDWENKKYQDIPPRLHV